MGVGRQAAYGVSAVLLALTLSGCTGPSTASQPAPGVTPTSLAPTSSPGSPPAGAPSSPPATSSAPSSLRPAIPAAARAHTSAGAEAFAMNYFAEVNRAWTSANSQRLRSMATPQCKTCANFVATADSLRTKGHHYAAPAVRAFAGVLLPETTANHVLVQIPTRQLSTKVIDREGRVVRVTAKMGVLSEVAIVWHSDVGWRIDSIKIALANEIQ